MDYRQIRKTAIQAIFSDDVLTHLLVLKGGNALDVGLNVASRASLDIDLSTPGAFDDVDEIRRRLFAALKEIYSTHGLVVFDESFVEIPPEVVDDPTPWWGGYRATFKLQSRERYEQLRTRPDKARIEAMPIGRSQVRTFKIDISKNEYCARKESRELDGCTIWVYSPAMLAIEKLRAICQQMPEYEVRGHKHSRARDFYFNFTSGEARKLHALWEE
jgi:Nucleotidyl transferase AbiEii toxin, Type IV TA system